MISVHHIVNDIHAGGGAEKIVRLLHRGLRDCGYDSSVLSLTAGSEISLDHFRSLNLSGPYHVSAVWKVASYIRKYCRKEHIIHAHLFPCGFWVSLAARLADFQGLVIFTEHSTNNRRRGRVIGWLADTIMYSGFHHIIAISDGTMRALGRWQPSFLHKIKVIENGTELVFSKYKFRQTKQTPVVLSAGRLSRLKNYDTSLAAVAMLKDMHFEYWIAGEGPEEASLKALCSRLGISGKVRFMGFVDNMTALYSQADVFLIPSRWEGFGLSAVEAMNAGLPVVASDVEGLRDIISWEKPCGILANPDEPVAFAAALRELLCDHEKRLVFGRNAFERAGEYSWEKNGKGVFYILSNYSCR